MRAVIFDMNGVIINDEWAHKESLRRFCKTHNFNLTEKEFEEKIFGRTEKAIFEFLYGHSLTPEELEGYSNERLDIALELFKPHLKMTEGLKSLLDNLVAKNIPLAVATNSRNRYFNFIMDNLGIRKYFKISITAQDVEKGKPDPEIYIKTAELLGVDPKECVVVEDGLMGIEAAKAAGMKVIAITSTHKREELAGADRIIDSFGEISLNDMVSV